MNAKLLFKTVFLIVMLSLLVLIGLYNRDSISFALPPILPKALKQPAAIMYYAFFAVGMLTGTILTAGSHKQAAPSGGNAKGGKSGK